MRELIIYEGTMCCSTGLCGPEPNKDLVEFTETIDKIKDEFKDITITRAGLSSNLNIFLENKEILKLVREGSPSILPIITFNGKIISKQKYLKYAQLKKFLSVKK